MLSVLTTTGPTKWSMDSLILFALRFRREFGVDSENTVNDSDWKLETPTATTDI